MITAYLFEYWDECRLYFSQPLLADSFAPIALMPLFLVATAALSAVFLLLATGIGDSFSSLLFRYRFLIGASITVLATLLGLSGSSISLWSKMYNGGSHMDLLMGIPREVRSDEWLVNTPFALSQLRDGLHPVSSLLAGGDTNVTTIYAQPCWSFSTLFHPFLWGYLFFDAPAGRAFFWTARLVILFLVTMQFGLYLFSQRRGISFVLRLWLPFLRRYSGGLQSMGLLSCSFLDKVSSSLLIAS